MKCELWLLLTILIWVHMLRRPKRSLGAEVMALQHDSQLTDGVKLQEMDTLVGQLTSKKRVPALSNYLRASHSYAGGAR